MGEAQKIDNGWEWDCLVAERDRFREALKNAADHHEDQRMKYAAGTVEADYHEERRNILLFHLNLM